MATYKTPDVYVEEISVFPPSVAEVETAVPAFIGYTEKAEHQGESLALEPTRIDSLVEYEERFGGAPPVTIDEVSLDANNSVQNASVTSPFFMYDALRLFFKNGGGKCYIISVGSYEDSPAKSAFESGLTRLRKEDEPTLILFPDAVLLDTDLYALQQQALSQCNDLKDRFAIFDLLESRSTDATFGWEEGYEEFRNRIGINYLKYGAAYTPYLKANLPKTIHFRDLQGNIAKQGSPIDLGSLATGDALEDARTTLNNLKAAVADVDAMTGDSAGGRENFLTNEALISGSTAETLKEGYEYLLSEFRTEISAASPDADDARTAFLNLMRYTYNALLSLVDAWADASSPLLTNSSLLTDVKNAISGTVQDLVSTLNGYNLGAETTVGGHISEAVDEDDATGYAWQADWGTAFSGASADTSVYPETGSNDEEQITNMEAAEDDITDVFNEINLAIGDMIEAAQSYEHTYEQKLQEEFPVYRNILSKVTGALTEMPPSGAVAGAYAAVDANRGVWKAPANVSLASVSGLTQKINSEDQEELNVDVNAGKSINAIRAFTGKGILIWGARTLAGNDNEWRYVPVRRFFNMVEESVKKSTYWAVFEPNDANLWTRVKAMIDNYLVQKWRDGALAGAKPDEAFYVNVGLGKTMTAQDILEGRLIIEIGLAVVRPAEFIILRFMHKMQES